jgi:hypothetical protein
MTKITLATALILSVLTVLVVGARSCTSSTNNNTQSASTEGQTSQIYRPSVGICAWRGRSDND